MVANGYAEKNELMIRIFICMAMACITLTACASIDTAKTHENAVVHVVLIWLKEQGNQKHIQLVTDVSKQLREIPEIQELRVGKSIPSGREIVDDSFDVGLYMIFNSQESMQHYLEHAEHKNAVKTVLKPLASRIQVYDFESVGK